MNSNAILDSKYFVIEELVKIHQSCEGQPDLVKLEYLYYTDLDLKGEALAEHLEKLNYETEVDATGRKCDYTRVFGTTTFIKSDDETIRKWCREMKSIGSYHECSFSCVSIIRNADAT